MPGLRRGSFGDESGSGVGRKHNAYQNNSTGASVLLQSKMRRRGGVFGKWKSRFVVLVRIPITTHASLPSREETSESSASVSMSRTSSEVFDQHSEITTRQRERGSSSAEGILLVFKGGKRKDLALSVSAVVAKLAKEKSNKTSSNSSSANEKRKLVHLSECVLRLAEGLTGQPFSLGLFPRKSHPWFLALEDEGTLREWTLALRTFCGASELEWTADESLEAYFLDPTLVASDRGTILNANESLLTLLGWTRNTLVGQNVSVLMPPAIAGAHAALMARYFSTGSKSLIGNPRPMSVARHDGSLVKVLLCLSESDDEFICTLKPLRTDDYGQTERKRANSGSQRESDTRTSSDELEEDYFGDSSSVSGSLDDLKSHQSVEENNYGRPPKGRSGSIPLNAGSSRFANLSLDRKLELLRECMLASQDCVAAVDNLLLTFSSPQLPEIGQDKPSDSDIPARGYRVFTPSTERRDVAAQLVLHNNLVQSDVEDDLFSFWYRNSGRSVHACLRAASVSAQLRTEFEAARSLTIGATLIMATQGVGSIPPLTRDEWADVRREQLVVEKLGSYVPRLVHRRLYNNSNTIRPPEVEPLHAAVMFADISGYTALSERMALVGQDSVGRLTEQLNRYFDSLIRVVFAHGGDIQAFAGDALLVCWPATSLAMVGGAVLLCCQCALTLLKDLKKYSVRVPAGKGQPMSDVDLRLHIGVGAGEIAGIHVGGMNNRLAYFISGSVLDQVAQCTKDASPGECIVSAAAWQLGAYGAAGAPNLSDDIKSVRGDPFMIGLRRNSDVWGRKVSTTVSLLRRARQRAVVVSSAAGYLLKRVVKPVPLPQIVDLLLFPDMRIALERYIEPVVLRHIYAEVDAILKSEERELGSHLDSPLRASESKPQSSVANQTSISREVDASPSTSNELTSFAELRSLTVVFVGFLDTFRVEAISDLQQILERCQRTIYEFDGMLRQFMVDDKGPVLIMAWGSPQATHLDDAFRAVSAALALAATLGVAYSMGIASGKGFVGDVGSAKRREYGIIGDCVNHSARLMGAAAAAAAASSTNDLPIFVDESTRHACGERMQWKSVGGLELKGKRELAQTFSPILYESLSNSSPQSVARSIGLETQLVGRDDELNLLHEFAAAYTGTESVRSVDPSLTRVIFIEGEAGSGKSALVSVLCSAFKRASTAVLRGYGSQYEAQTPFFPWRQLFVNLAEKCSSPEAILAVIKKHVGTDNIALSRIQEVLPEFARLKSNDETADESRDIFSSEQETHEHFRDAFIHVLQEIVPRGSLLVFQDAHWFDHASFALLHAVATHVSGLLICVSTLSLAAPPSSLRLLLHNDLTFHMHLEAFDRETTGQLCQLLLECQHVPDEVVTAVFERSGGNPFVVTKLVESMVHADVVRICSDGACEVTSAVAHNLSTAIPSSVSGLLTRTLDGLKPFELLVLKTAACIGTSFDASLLKDAVSEGAAPPPRLSSDGEFSAEYVLPALHHLEAIALLIDNGDGTFSFANTLVMDVVLQLMLQSQRKTVHLKLASVLRQKYSDDPQWWPAIAHHYRSADSPEAIEYLIRCGSRCLDSYDTHEAIELLSNASEMLESIDDPVSPESDPRHQDLKSEADIRPSSWTAFASISLHAVRLHRKLALAYQRVGNNREAHRQYLFALQSLGVKLFEHDGRYSASKVLKIKWQRWRLVGEEDESRLLAYFAFRKFPITGKLEHALPLAFPAAERTERRDEIVLCLLRIAETELAMQLRDSAVAISQLITELVEAPVSTLFPEPAVPVLLREVHAFAALCCGLRVKAKHALRATDPMFLEAKRHLSLSESIGDAENVGNDEHDSLLHETSREKCTLWKGFYYAGHAHVHENRTLDDLRFLSLTPSSKLRPGKSKGKTTHSCRGVWAKSLACFREALNHARAHGDLAMAERCLVLQATVLIVHGDSRHALRDAQKAVKSATRRGDVSLAGSMMAARSAYCIGNLAGCLNWLNASSLLLGVDKLQRVADIHLSQQSQRIPAPIRKKGSKFERLRRRVSGATSDEGLPLSNQIHLNNRDVLTFETIEWLLMRGLIFFHAKNLTAAWQHFEAAVEPLLSMQSAFPHVRRSPCRFFDFEVYAYALELCAQMARSDASRRAHARLGESDPVLLPSLLHLTTIFARVSEATTAFTDVFPFAMPRLLLWQGVMFAARHKFAEAEERFTEALSIAIGFEMPGDVALILVERYRCYASPTSESESFAPVARNLQYAALATSAHHQKRSIKEDLLVAKELCSSGAGAVARLKNFASEVEAVAKLPVHHDVHAGSHSELDASAHSYDGSESLSGIG